MTGKDTVVEEIIPEENDAGIFSIEVKRNELEKLFIQLSDYLKMPAPLTQAPCGSNPGECIIKMDKQVKEARQDEREKVLDDLEHYIQYETPLEQFSKYCLAYTDVLQKVKNLRKKDGE